MKSRCCRDAWGGKEGKTRGNTSHQYSDVCQLCTSCASRQHGISTGLDSSPMCKWNPKAIAPAPLGRAVHDSGSQALSRH
ncbi:hypothetical protein CB1_000740059 [Camelus ferus]|nr:hypothetical protein CB1_000740059 [Camelus ferus]